jgi:hypothetical protein
VFTLGGRIEGDLELRESLAEINAAMSMHVRRWGIRSKSGHLDATGHSQRQTARPIPSLSQGCLVWPRWVGAAMAWTSASFGVC